MHVAFHEPVFVRHSPNERLITSIAPVYDNAEAAELCWRSVASPPRLCAVSPRERQLGPWVRDAAAGAAYRTIARCRNGRGADQGKVLSDLHQLVAAYKLIGHYDGLEPTCLRQAAVIAVPGWRRAGRDGTGFMQSRKGGDPSCSHRMRLFAARVRVLVSCWRHLPCALARMPARRVDTTLPPAPKPTPRLSCRRVARPSYMGTSCG